MFGTRWRLFRLLGIPINVDASWLIILALLTWTLISFFGQELPDQPPATYWIMGLGTALAFFTCLVLHELGHALAARALGIPIRGITLFLFGGIAELEGEPQSAQSEFFMAIAGPVVSAVLAATFWLLSGLAWGPAVDLVLEYLASINLAVLVFNLVPGFPLDGGRVLRSLLWAGLGNLRRATYVASLVGQGFAWLLIALGVMHFFAGMLVQGMWLGLIGMFLNNAARSSYQQVIIRQLLQGEPISRFMTRDVIVVPTHLDLLRWVEEYVFGYHRKMFPVTADGHLAGVITTQALANYPREEWSRHSVEEAMNRDLDALCIPPHTDALEALAKMQRTDSSRLLVTEGDRLVGIVSLKDLLAFLDLKLELENGGK